MVNRRHVGALMGRLGAAALALCVILAFSIGCATLKGKPTKPDQQTIISGFNLAAVIGCDVLRQQEPKAVPDALAVIDGPVAQLLEERPDLVTAQANMQALVDKPWGRYIAPAVQLVRTYVDSLGVVDRESTYFTAIRAVVDGCRSSLVATG